MIWYQADNGRACFGFAFDGDRITVCAPIGRRWLMGRTRAEARVELRKRGCRVVEVP